MTLRSRMSLASRSSTFDIPQMICEAIQSDATHRYLILSLAHLRESIFVAIWNEDAIPLEIAIAARLGSNSPLDLPLKVMNLATIAITDPGSCRDRRPISSAK